MKNMIRTAIFFLALPLSLFGADPGFHGGVKFQRQDLITATTSLSLTGSAATTGEFHLQAGSNVTINEYTGASTTWKINSTAGGGSATTTYYLHYSARFPSPSLPGEDDPSTNSVLLSATSTTGIDFANEKIPQVWDGTSDLIPQIAISTQAIPSASSFTLQLHGQIIKSGSPCWGDNRYTIFATRTFLLASTTAMQFFQNSNFRIPAASATRGSYVHIRFFRVPGFAGDTYGKQIYFDSMAIKLGAE